MIAPSTHHFALERSVDCACDRRLALPLLHYARWSEVQSARCCGCGKVQCYIPEGDDPRTSNAAGANRVVRTSAEVVAWLEQWGSLVDGDAQHPSTWLPPGLTCTSYGSLEMLIQRVRARGSNPGACMREAGFPLAPPPLCEDPQLQAALAEYEAVRMALNIPAEHDIEALFKLADPAHPAHHVAMDLLVRHPGLHEHLMALQLNDRNAPWRMVLELLHWSDAPMRLWQQVLEAFSSIPFTSLDGVADYVRERMCIHVTMERLAHLRVPEALLLSTFNTLIQRTASADSQLHGDLVMLSAKPTYNDDRHP
jgi:hypothetical protein